LRIASGVRSSWPAFATNAFSRVIASSSRASISLSVAPSRCSSSCGPGTGSRSPRAMPEMRAARARMRSTGASALRVSA
jgi:hypothetical protein